MSYSDSTKEVREKSVTARKATIALINAVRKTVGPVGPEFHATCNDFLLLCKKIEKPYDWEEETKL